MKPTIIVFWGGLLVVLCCQERSEMTRNASGHVSIMFCAHMCVWEHTACNSNNNNNIKNKNNKDKKGQ